MQQPQSTRKELRQFGLLVGAVFSVVGLWPVLFRSEPPRLWALVLGSALIVLGLAWPPSLTHVHAVWMKIGHVLGMINSRLILSLIYFVFITPMGIIMRLIGRDAMHRTLKQDATTYRAPRTARPRRHMQNQF